MSLLTTPIVKNSHILSGISFIFLKKILRPNLKGFKSSESSYQVSTIFSAFLKSSCSNVRLEPP